MIEAIVHNEMLRDLLYVLLVTAALDTLSGIYAAWKGGSFNLKLVDSFIRDHVLTRIFPIMLTAFGSVTLNGDTAGALWVAAAAQVAAYEAATVKSLIENVQSAQKGAPNLPDGT